MVSTIKKKRNPKRIDVNLNKRIFKYIIFFIFEISILPKLNENRIVQSGLYSITAKFKKSSSDSQIILDCGFFSHYSITFTAPEKMRINNITEVNYNKTKSNNLKKEENIVEYFWENVSINSCIGMFYGCKNLIEIDFSNFNTSNVTSTLSMFDY